MIKFNELLTSGISHVPSDFAQGLKPRKCSVNLCGIDEGIEICKSVQSCKIKQGTANSDMYWLDFPGGGGGVERLISDFLFPLESVLVGCAFQVIYPRHPSCHMDCVTPSSRFLAPAGGSCL